MIIAKYFVYLLKSTVSNRTYVGYTVGNVYRRLRKHNGEITGGAKRTKKGRPWKVVMFVSFEHERTAMQYEFCIQHTKKYRRTSGIANKMKIMKSLIHYQERICSTAPPNRELRKVFFFSDEQTMQLWNSL